MVLDQARRGRTKYQGPGTQEYFRQLMQGAVPRWVQGVPPGFWRSRTVRLA